MMMLGGPENEIVLAKCHALGVEIYVSALCYYVKRVKDGKWLLNSHSGFSNKWCAIEPVTAMIKAQIHMDDETWWGHLK